MLVGIVARERETKRARSRIPPGTLEPVWGNDTSSGASPRFTVSQGFGHGLVPSNHGQRDSGGGRHRAGAHQIGSGGDVGRKIAVVIEPRDPFAQACAHALQRRARSQRRVKVAALRRRDQLDRHDVGGILRHTAEPARACAAIATWSSWLAEVGIESTLAG